MATKRLPGNNALGLFFLVSLLILICFVSTASTAAALAAICLRMAATAGCVCSDLLAIHVGVTTTHVAFVWNAQPSKIDPAFLCRRDRVLRRPYTMSLRPSEPLQHRKAAARSPALLSRIAPACMIGTRIRFIAFVCRPGGQRNAGRSSEIDRHERGAYRAPAAQNTSQSVAEIAQHRSRFIIIAATNPGQPPLETRNSGTS
jgi:hypothetical protein